MSRTVSNDMASAINKVSGIKSAARITIFKSRNHFDALDQTSGSPTYAPVTGSISETPIPQDVFVDSANDRVYSIFTDPVEEYIVLGTSGSNVNTTVFSSGSPVSSPKWHKFSVHFPYLYHMTTTGSLCVEEFDPISLRDNLTSGSANLISSGSTITPIYTSGSYSTSGSYCGLVAVDEFELVKLFIDDGGFGIEQIQRTTGSWITNTYEHRFMIPEEVYDEVDATGYMLNYFHAVKRTDGIWAYFSYPSGEVKGIHLNTHGEWGDIFTAVPKDLSVFKIGNAFVDSNERIHLCGQFQRVDEFGAFSSSSIWNLLTWTDDGKIFTLDRNTLFSLMGNRFVVAQDGTTIYFTDLNKYKTLTAAYPSVYEDADSLTIRNPLISIGGSPESGYGIDIRTPNDALVDHTLIEEGNIVKLEIGINTSGSTIDFITFDTCMLVSSGTDLENGVRSLALEILTESTYRLQLFTYPFYLEMQGKQSIYDPIKDMSNFYKAPNASNLTEPFYIDFWQNEDLFLSGGLYMLFHNTSGNYEVMSGDIKEYMYLGDYPVIDELPLTFKIYGWSRIGIPSNAPQVTNDSTPASNPNDDWVAIIKVQHEDGSEDTFTMNKGDSVANSYMPQYWKEGNSRLTTGNMPVQYSIGVEDGLVIGDKVLEVGVNASSSSCTVFYPERIEIPELTMCIDPSALPQDSHIIKEANSYDEVNKKDITYNFADSFNTWSTITPTTEDVGGDVSGTDAYGGGVWSITYGACLYVGSATYANGRLSKEFGDLYDVTGGTVTFNVMIQMRSLYWGHGGVEVTFRYDDGTFSPNYHITGKDFDEYINHVYPSDYVTPTTWFEKEFSFSSYGTQKRITEVMFDYHTFAGAGGVFRVVITDITLAGFSGIINENNYLDTEDKTALKIKNVGIPNVYFSSKPYSAFNFESSVKVKVKGDYAHGGIVGIAEDGQNYVCGEISEDAISIVKVRNGERTTLASLAYASGTVFKRLMFIHNNGDLYIRMQDYMTWGEPLLSYRWKYTDGPMATDVDLFHVGIYSFIDAPKFRICAFDPGQSQFIGILPGCDDSDFADFPSSGQVEIDNILYNYTYKVTSSEERRGPFQVRCCNSWNYTHPDDGEAYSGVSIEIANFEWQYNPTHHNKYHNMILASSAGYGYKIEETDFKTWITTAGDLVYITNRERVFCQGLSSELTVSCMDKAYITYGLGGVTVDPEGDRGWHQDGTYCYISCKDKVEFTDFYASSEEHDTTIRDLITKISRMAGAKALFPGDRTIATKALSANSEEEI